MPEGFTVDYRNPGHWDISTRRDGRLFTIRGEPGDVIVHDTRARGGPSREFKNVADAMTCVCEELMWEPQE